MSKFIVAVFPDENVARRGSEAFRELHSAGSVTLHGMTLVRKGADGNVATADTMHPGLPNAAVGALVGGLIGLLGGPVGAALGASGGAWLGSWRDISHLGLGADFVEQVARALTPGRAAVVAEVDEERVTPLDERMEALGGVLVREWRADFAEGRLAQEAAARKVEVAQLEAERAQASAARRAALDVRLDEARARLAGVADRARAKLAELERETEVRLRTMQDQAAQAGAETKVRIEQRMVETRADHDRRAALLRQALELTRGGRA